MAPQADNGESRAAIQPDSEIVTIRVIDDSSGQIREDTFKIFKCLLVKHSTYFAAVFQVAGVSEMTLHCRLYLFHGLMQWLNFQHERELKNGIDRELDWTPIKYDCTCTLFDHEDSLYQDIDPGPALCNGIDFYLFADTFQIPRLRHDATDRILRALSVEADSEDWDHVVSPDMIEQIYSKTAPGSILRRVFIDAFCAWPQDEGKTTPTVYVYLLRDLPKEFLTDVMDKYRSDIRPYIPETSAIIEDLDPCDYHNHTDAMERDQCEGSRIKPDV